jgi:hypothetical protein
MLTNPGIIPPLQSFLVAKKSGTANLAGVKMSPAFTTTRPSASYTLRAENVLTGGLLSITASQGNATASTALVYDLEASPGNDGGDLPTAVYDALPLTIYTLTNMQAPLLMNSSSDFEAGVIPVGMRVANAGEGKLTFDGLDSFGYDVYLTDRLMGVEKHLTSSDNAYNFTIAKTGNDAVEVNDRFSLRMTYTGRGITTDTHQPPVSSQGEVDLMVVSSADESITVSGLRPGTMLYVYDMEGKLVYQAKVNVTSIVLPPFRGQGVVITNDGRSVKAVL